MPKGSPCPLRMAFSCVFFVQLGLNTSACLWFLLPAVLLSPALEGFPACWSLKAPSALPGLLCSLGLPTLLVSCADVDQCVCILRPEHTELMGSLSLIAVVVFFFPPQLAVPWDSAPPRQALSSAASDPRVNTTKNGGYQEGVVRAAVLCCCVPLLMRNSRRCENPSTCDLS